MKQILRYSAALCICMIAVSANAQNFSWAGYPSGGNFYSTSDAGVTMTVNVIGTGYLPNKPTYDSFGVKELFTGVNWSNSSESVSHNIEFSQPLEGVNFVIYDCDKSHYGNADDWEDLVIITGKDAAGNDIYPQITNAPYNIITGANSNELLGTQDNYFTPQNPSLINFGAGVFVKSLIVLYRPGPGSLANPGQEWIGIGPINSLSGGSLPITLKDFKANINGSDALLSWKSEAQVNFFQFQIERSATGRGSFEKIGFVNGAAASSANYSYIDKNIKAKMPVAYYRLKMIDIDGKFTYSNVVVVRFEKGVTLDVRPTILRSGQLISVSLAGSGRDIYDIRLVNISGQVLQSKRSAAGTQVQLETGNLNAGMYFVKVSGETTSETIKVMVR